MEAFRFALSNEEKQALKQLVRQAIEAGLEESTDWSPPPSPTPRLEEHYGAFVTLTIDGELRGCIGHIIGDRPLWLTIADMARAAAFDDPRFPPLSRQEFQAVHIEISVLGPVTPCPDPALVQVGRHGLIMVQGGRQGLLLPQVAVEWRWDRETFLAHTCRKAGLPPDAWRSPKTSIYWFEAEIF